MDFPPALLPQNTTTIVPKAFRQRPALPRLGSLRTSGFKKDNSWYVLGYDSNSSSQHYCNMLYRNNRSDSTKSLGKDSWAALTMSSAYKVGDAESIMDASFATLMSSEDDAKAITFTECEKS